jgi:hypothetical protein
MDQYGKNGQRRRPNNDRETTTERKTDNNRETTTDRKPDNEDEKTLILRSYGLYLDVVLQSGGCFG